jgi:hypothetical protein
MNYDNVSPSLSSTVVQYPDDSELKMFDHAFFSTLFFNICFNVLLLNHGWHPFYREVCSLSFSVVGPPGISVIYIYIYRFWHFCAASMFPCLMDPKKWEC